MTLVQAAFIKFGDNTERNNFQILSSCPINAIEKVLEVWPSFPLVSKAGNHPISFLHLRMVLNKVTKIPIKSKYFFLP